MTTKEGTMPDHLWDIHHSYYSSDSNYRADGYENHGLTEYASWAEFYEEFKDADLDYNYLVRWDWKRPDPSDYEEGEEPDWTNRLHLYYVAQRKGDYRPIIVDVEENNEDDVRAFLARHAVYARSMWAGL